MVFRDRLDVERFVEELGIHAVRRGSSLRAVCPSPDHDDHDPSWSIVDAPGTRKHGGHRCFACGFSGGPWELAMAVRGFDEDQAQQYVTAFILDRPREFPGLPKVVVRERPSRPHYRLPTAVRFPSLEGTEMPRVFADYLEGRGVTQSQIEKWQIGYATRGRLAWRIVIPVYTRGKLVAHVARAVFADRERYDMPVAAFGAEPSVALLGEPFLRDDLDTLTIAEGSFSLLALERAGAPNPVALLGSDWSIERAAVLSRRKWSTVIIATDPDKAGDKAAASIAVSFRQSKIVRLRLGKSPDDSTEVELGDALRRPGGFGRSASL